MTRLAKTEIVEKQPGVFTLVLDERNDVFTAPAESREEFLRRIIEAREKNDLAVMKAVPAFLRKALKSG